MDGGDVGRGGGEECQVREIKKRGGMVVTKEGIEKQFQVTYVLYLFLRRWLNTLRKTPVMSTHPNCWSEWLMVRMMRVACKDRATRKLGFSYATERKTHYGLIWVHR